jgi:hypothetical protein
MIYCGYMDVMTFRPAIIPIFISHMLLPEDYGNGPEYAGNL